MGRILTLFLCGVVCGTGCADDEERPVDGGVEDADARDTPSDADVGRQDGDADGGDRGDGGEDAGDGGDGGDGDVDLPHRCEDGPGPGCTCVTLPVDESAACWHSLGGRYGHGACSTSYQCCDGAWINALDSCGACACTESTGLDGCVPVEAGVEACFDDFEGDVLPLPPDIVDLMTGSSWRPECPLSLDELSLLRFSHLGFDGAVHQGELVVATRVAGDVLGVFEHLYRSRFALERVRLVDHYDADDDLSMADNNTSAFNCRMVTGGSSWSMHSYGTAIDINPVQNPYVIGATVLPPEGAEYLDREDVRLGMVVDPGPVTGAFRAIGWGWGGDWSSIKDYQHFSESGN